MPEKRKRKVSANPINQGGFLSSAGKVLDVLELLSSRPSISVTELSLEKKLPISTAYRALATLARRGYALKKKDRRYYQGPKLGPKLKRK